MKDVKYVHKMLLAGISAFLFSAQAMASVVYVEGNTYSSTSCGYYTSTLGVFSVHYQDHHLPEGSKVQLIYGFHDQVKNKIWVASNKIALTKTELGLWEGTVNAITAERGTSYFDVMDMTFEVTLPSGEVYLDNGEESPDAHYAAQIPQSIFTCTPAPLKDLPVSVSRI